MPTEEWAVAFKEEHGYFPWEDPDLLGKGYSPDQALADHLDAKKFGEGFAKDHGRAPNEHEYRYNYFKGWTPENVEALEREGPYKYFGIERGKRGPSQSDAGPMRQPRKVPRRRVPTPPSYNKGGY